MAATLEHVPCVCGCVQPCVVEMCKMGGSVQMLHQRTMRARPPVPAVPPASTPPGSTVSGTTHWKTWVLSDAGSLPTAYLQVNRPRVHQTI
jgi:hypothetical protein